MIIVMRDDSLVTESWMHIGIAGIGIYLPPSRMTAGDLSAATGVPEDVITLKFGVREKPVAGLANTAVYKVLASYFRIPEQKIRMIRGFKQRNKLFEIKID